jgi:hypothetical protein
MSQKASNRRSSRVRRDVVLDYEQTIQNQLDRPPSSSGSEPSRDALRGAKASSRKRKAPDESPDKLRTRSNPSKSVDCNVPKDFTVPKKHVRSKAASHQSSEPRPSMALVELDSNIQSQPVRPPKPVHEQAQEVKVHSQSSLRATAHEEALMSPQAQLAAQAKVLAPTCPAAVLVMSPSPATDTRFFS